MSANKAMLARQLAGSILGPTVANSARVLVFSKTTCPFCQRIKSYMGREQIPYSAVELDMFGRGAQIQAELLKITGQRTVPNVFVENEHIGGSDDALAYFEKEKEAGRL